MQTYSTVYVNARFNISYVGLFGMLQKGRCHWRDAQGSRQSQGTRSCRRLRQRSLCSNTSSSLGPSRETADIDGGQGKWRCINTLLHLKFSLSCLPAEQHTALSHGTDEDVFVKLVNSHIRALATYCCRHMSAWTITVWSVCGSYDIMCCETLHFATTTKLFKLKVCLE
jgi:hypothetical protein